MSASMQRMVRDASRETRYQIERLLRLEMRDGEIGYPVFQFDGRRKLPGIREVIDILGPVVASPWTIASWLTSPAAALDGRAPVQILRDGRIEAVTAAARRTAEALAR